MSDQLFETPYRRDRRTHRHRCRSCNRIVRDGEPVLMVRTGRRSFVVHVEECADAELDGMTWRTRFAYLAGERP